MFAKSLCCIALVVFLSAAVSIAQSSPAEENLIKAGYLLSVESNRLNKLRNEITEIRKKKMALNEPDNPEDMHIKMLIENVLLIETICMYESLLLNTFESIEEREKIDQYKLLYSRLKKDTLKRLYLNFKSTQTNFMSIEDNEISELSVSVKKEMLRVLRIIEEVISTLQSQIQGTQLQ